MLSNQKVVLSIAQIAHPGKSVSTTFRGRSLILFLKSSDETTFPVEEKSTVSSSFMILKFLSFALYCKIQMYIYSRVGKYICSFTTVYLSAQCCQDSHNSSTVLSVSDSL